MSACSEYCNKTVVTEFSFVSDFSFKYVFFQLCGEKCLPRLMMQRNALSVRHEQHAAQQLLCRSTIWILRSLLPTEQLFTEKGSSKICYKSLSDRSITITMSSIDFPNLFHVLNVSTCLATFLPKKRDDGKSQKRRKGKESFRFSPRNGIFRIR